MENSTIKKACRRGFTLIELMIVIVILGVLMGTILPRITGGQARARDTGRIADLNTISQALETYYDDFGQYPGAIGTEYCLDGAESVAFEDDLGDYLKGGAVPTPPSSGQKTTIASKTCTGSYYYAPLENRGLDLNGYVLATDVETWQMANVNTSSGTFTPLDVDTFAGNIDAVDTATMETADDTSALSSIYMLVN
ncbi:prepilin-type N-terminal cleavage/methylation domain-containing protein [Patescibacteria group bacterium]|nr:prepilin-type N-terminal cleavage/methylation domain-containing protein [Patescibacteria group bacterium]